MDRFSISSMIHGLFIFVISNEKWTQNFMLVDPYYGFSKMFNEIRFAVATW